MERTFILLKPDCVQRRLMGRIITRFEEKGLNVIAAKMLVITPELAKQHYAEHVSKGSKQSRSSARCSVPPMA